MMSNTSIQPKLKTFDLTMIFISLVIGMGIFRTPAEVAIKGQTPTIFFAAWILGGIITLIGALTFAEIGSRFPAAGGFYKLFSFCYHPSFAFMVNWVTVISNAASVGGVAIMGAEYLAPIILPEWENHLAVQTITFSSVAILFGMNMLGIKVSSKVLNVLMIIKLSMLLLLILAMFFVEGKQANETFNAPIQTTADMFKAFALCFVPVFFTYSGYQQSINFGGDAINPNKTIPRSVNIGIVVILAVYLTVNYSYYKVLGFSGLQTSTTLASDISGLMFGNMASKLVSVIMFFSVMAYVNVSLMANPRVYFAMAEDGVLPKIFKKVNSKTQVQEFGLSFFTLLIFVILFFISSFQKILEYVMFFDSISLITAAAAIFILRNRAKKLGESIDIYKMKGYPYLPIIYILVFTAVNLSVMLANPTAFLWGAVLFISGFPLYYLIKFIIKKI